MKTIPFLALLAALPLTTFHLQGMGQSFTDQAAFLNALPGSAGVLNFEGVSGGTDLSGVTLAVSGGPNVGVVFPVSVSDYLGTTLHLQVVANNPTSSSPNSLGTDDNGNFYTIMGGTVINLGLTRQVNAFGLSFIIPEQMLDGDITLLAGNETAALLTDNRTLVGNFSGTDYYAYFLGLVTSGGFNSASIHYGPNTDGAFFYNADDITVSMAPSKIPEPSTPLLFLAGALAALAGRKR